MQNSVETVQVVLILLVLTMKLRLLLSLLISFKIFAGLIVK